MQTPRQTVKKELTNQQRETIALKAQRDKFIRRTEADIEILRNYPKNKKLNETIDKLQTNLQVLRTERIVNGIYTPNAKNALTSINDVLSSNYINDLKVMYEPPTELTKEARKVAQTPRNRPNAQSLLIPALPSLEESKDINIPDAQSRQSSNPTLSQQQVEQIVEETKSQVTGQLRAKYNKILANQQKQLQRQAIVREQEILMQLVSSQSELFSNQSFTSFREAQPEQVPNFYDIDDIDEATIDLQRIQPIYEQVQDPALIEENQRYTEPIEAVSKQVKPITYEQEENKEQLVQMDPNENERLRNVMYPEETKELPNQYTIESSLGTYAINLDQAQVLDNQRSAFDEISSQSSKKSNSQQSNKSSNKSSQQSESSYYSDQSSGRQEMMQRMRQSYANYDVLENILSKYREDLMNEYAPLPNAQFKLAIKRLEQFKEQYYKQNKKEFEQRDFTPNEIKNSLIQYFKDNKLKQVSQSDIQQYESDRSRRIDELNNPQREIISNKPILSEQELLEQQQKQQEYEKFVLYNEQEYDKFIKQRTKIKSEEEQKRLQKLRDEEIQRKLQRIENRTDFEKTIQFEMQPTYELLPNSNLRRFIYENYNDQLYGKYTNEEINSLVNNDYQINENYFRLERDRYLLYELGVPLNYVDTIVTLTKKLKQMSKKTKNDKNQAEYENIKKQIALLKQTIVLDYIYGNTELTDEQQGYNDDNYESAQSIEENELVQVAGQLQTRQQIEDFLLIREMQLIAQLEQDAVPFAGQPDSSSSSSVSQAQQSNNDIGFGLGALDNQMQVADNQSLQQTEETKSMNVQPNMQRRMSQPTNISQARSQIYGSRDLNEDRPRQSNISGTNVSQQIRRNERNITSNTSDNQSMRSGDTTIAPSQIMRSKSANKIMIDLQIDNDLQAAINYQLINTKNPLQLNRMLDIIKGKNKKNIESLGQSLLSIREEKMLQRKAAVNKLKETKRQTLSNQLVYKESPNNKRVEPKFTTKFYN